MKRYFLLALLGSMLFAQDVNAQCCSMGNPLAGSTYSTDPVKGQLQINAYYKHGYNETYFRKNVRLVNYGIYSHSGYDFTGLALSYSVTNRLTIEHENGYYLKKEVRYLNQEIDALVVNGYGLSNGLLGFRYLIFGGKPGATNISAGGGVKYPYSTEMFTYENVELPIELQPSTRAWGVMAQVFVTKDISRFKLNISHRSEFNQRNKDKYLYGNMHTSSVSLSGKILKNLFAQAGFRNEFKLSDKTPTNARLASEGSNMVIFTPKIGYQLPADFHVSVFADLPAYKYYFGEQLSMQYAIGISIAKSFNLLKEDSD
jgi:hypothetical protein